MQQATRRKKEEKSFYTYACYIKTNCEEKTQEKKKRKKKTKTKNGVNGIRTHITKIDGS